MDSATTYKILGCYGLDVARVLAKANLPTDAEYYDIDRVTHVSRVLAASAERKHQNKLAKLSGKIGMRFRNAVCVAEVNKQTLSDDVTPCSSRMFMMLCDCGELFYLPSFKLRGMRACPKCIGENQFLVGVSVPGSTSRLFPKQYGALTRLHQDPDDVRKYVCKCACGNTKSVFKSALYGGRTKTCGCGINMTAATAPQEHD